MAPKAKTDQELVNAALEAEVDEGAPDTSRFMLRDALPFALSGGDQSHAYQVEVLRLVDAHLERLADRAQEAIEAENRKVDVHRALAAEAESGVSITTEAYDKSIEELHMRDAAVRELNEKVCVEERRYQDTVRASKALIANMEKLEAEQVETRDLLENLQVQGPLSQSVADAAVDFLKEEHAEKTLICAAASALATDPAEAHPFDLVVKETVVTAARGKLHKLESDIAERSQHVAYAKAENLGAWAIWECAQDRLLAAQSASVEATAQQSETKEASQAAKRHLKEQKAALSAALIEQTLTEVKQQEVRDAQAAFYRLRNPAPIPVADGAVDEQHPCPMLVS